MTDRDIDLIRAAGKAAGLTLQLALGFTLEDRDLFTPDGQRWNPLTDDGDALRLAVALDLSSLMIFSYSDGSCQGKRREFWSPNSGYDGGKSATTQAEYAADPYAATRRAIVRAAAAMAKADA